MKVNRFVSLALATVVLAAPGSALAARSPADQALYDKAVAACNGPSYPSGSTPRVNYQGGWFTCKEPNTGNRR